MRCRSVFVVVVAAVVAFIALSVSSARGADAPATTHATTSASADWTILFRADDPLIWNTDAGGDAAAANGYAITLDKTPQDVRYLRIKRMDTGDAVIIPATRDIVIRKGNLGGEYYWNGATDPVTGDGKTNRVIGLAYRPWNT